ncbi:MAG: hypothetical protein AAF611_09400 [Bacteroidota bacterium]
MNTELQKKSTENTTQSAVAHTAKASIETQGFTLKDNRNPSSIIQKMQVIQLATRLVRNVIFNGYSETLRQLLLQWAVPNGTRVQIQQTDHVGGAFDVRFTNTNGPAISIDTARGWIQTAISHHQESSSEDESSSGDENE